MKYNRVNIEREVLARFFQLSNKLQTFLDQQLKNDNLTAKQLFLMIVLGSFDNDPGFSELSERFGTSRQNIKQLALKLEKNGYVELYTDEMDSRYKRIRFAEKAINYWQKRDDMDMLILNKMFQTVSLDRLKLFQDTMKQIDSNINLLSNIEENDNEDDN